MKKVLIFVGGAIGLVAVAITAVFLLTSGMTKTADTFFNAAASGDFDSAYEHLSADFKASTSKADLTAYLKANRLDTYEKANWHSRSTKGSWGAIKGSVTITDESVIPLNIEFVKADDVWAIYSIKRPSSGLQTESSSAQVPTDREVVSLIAESMLTFAHAVNKKSMKGFHDHISYLWQKQTTPEALDKAFASIVAANVDLTVLKKFSPQLNAPPELDENGTLIMAGHYPTKPSRVSFKHKYVFEGLNWRLVGFSVDIK